MTNEVKQKAGSTGWSPERRAAQAARMRARKPWLKSTGPRSAAGKRTAKMNALKHGHRSAQWRELSRLLRVQQLFVARWRAGRYHPPKYRYSFSNAIRENAVPVAHRPRRIGGLSQSPHWRDRWRRRYLMADPPPG